ncbi:hydroxymyristoyl-ACP dehydratase [Xanthocytophaga flava]|uniref:hydroxymyristoyl-ACP dehydratase n=1 Tax=Xanthocytophaga flava TaxID=3048013 RepID=UPI0028D4E819|nr:hydroxymyristoyl-ACP dehydratase [Xanthocytophaga flavus]MDJ1472181.1 hydroxymyristoyl-ACP dehydratase [Xanthocytophaga flavus]
MLINNLYTILQFDHQEKIEVSAQINVSHPIFKGHFPSMPILPGVCMVQLVKELIEKVHPHQTLLTHAGNIKFLSVINPEINDKVKVTIEIRNSDTNNITFTSYISQDQTIVFKFTGQLQNI